MSVVLTVAAVKAIGLAHKAGDVSTAKPVSVTSLMFQLLLGLGVVLGIIWVAARIMRGRMGIHAAKRKAAPLAVIGRQPLGKGVQVAVVKAGAEMYLLGVTAHQVTRLARYRPDPEDELESTDDLPPAVRAEAGALVPAAFRLQSPFRLQSSIRQLQDRTLRRR